MLTGAGQLNNDVRRPLKVPISQPASDPMPPPSSQPPTGSRPPLPSGRIIIVFTDIENSSRMTAALGDAVYRRAVGEPHGACLRAAIQECGGAEVKTIGDS